MKQRYIRVSKLGAAKRQVEQALDTFFADGDPVAIHTLLYASVDILHALYKRKTGNLLFFSNDAMNKAGVIDTVHHWPNFFKHGRKRHELDSEIAFNPDSNLVLFCACLAALEELGQDRSDLAKALLFWLRLRAPEMVSGASLPNGNELRRLKRLGKKRFIKEFLQAGRRIRARRRRASR